MGGRYDDYSQPSTLRCERALVTFVGDIGPWSRRIVLVGGLAPRYLVGSVPLGASPHVGTTDVDLVVQLAVEQDFETYTTLATNLKNSGFSPDRDSYRWSRQVDGATVSLEFLCETDQVDAGRIYRTRQGTGSRFGAVNIPGAQLATQDFIEATVEAERLDNGGLSTVTFRVGGLLAYVVLKILAFQQRHHNKDAYDLVYTLVNYPNGGPRTAGRAAATSPIREDPRALEALRLLKERFISIDRDGPSHYANFLTNPHDAEGTARRRNEAVAAVTQFLTAAEAE